MVTTSGADYDSPRRQSETADRFNFSQVETFSSGTEEGVRVPVYLPDSPRFSPIEGSEACNNGLGFNSLTVSMFCSGSLRETALCSAHCNLSPKLS
jgi:hypothetical protein